MGKINKKAAIYIAIALCALLIAACPQSRRFTRTGTLRDTLFSVEERGNGALIVWVTHDDAGAYCFGVSDEHPSVEDLIDHQGEVVITYSDIALNGDGCSNAESSQEGSGFHTYKVHKIRLVPARAGTGN
jgi:hypothetical protein